MSAKKLISTGHPFCSALDQIAAEPDRLAIRRPSWSEGLTIRFYSGDKTLCWYNSDWNYLNVSVSGYSITATDWEIWEVEE